MKTTLIKMNLLTKGTAQPQLVYYYNYKTFKFVENKERTQSKAAQSTRPLYRTRGLWILASGGD